MRQELQRCWVFHTQQFPLFIKNGPQHKEYPANLTQLWEGLESTCASITVEHFQHLVESMPLQIKAVLRAKGGATQYLEVVPNVLYTQCIKGRRYLQDRYLKEERRKELDRQKTSRRGIEKEKEPGKDPLLAWLITWSKH